ITVFLQCYFFCDCSLDEDEELLFTDPESKEKNKDKKLVCKVKWSRDEDDKLKKLVNQHGTESWKLIATFFPGRTDGQCQHRWQKVLNPELVKGPWTKEEDQKVSRAGSSWYGNQEGLMNRSLGRKMDAV
uniref:Uncharacterized protein n=1 Tax=Cyprinodon variegatus TaxID=28743 RepID=A0A3Q2EBW4_CYPVA